MQQILVTIPPGFPLFGYGMMLFLAYIACTRLGIYLGRRVGIAPEVFKDIVLWFFGFGILGARITYFIFEVKGVPTPWQFLSIWDGGLVFYGSVPGAILGFFIGDRFIQRRYPYDRWKFADCVAPCIALGIALGRIGCLLNGCCYGNVACEACPAIHFPIPSPPRFAMVQRGLQTTAGFTVDRVMQRKVDFVEPDSGAESGGLKVGDVIVKVNDIDVTKDDETFAPLHNAFGALWPRGKNDVNLTIDRNGVERTLNFRPRGVGLHPTQVYESISMTLMLGLLLSYFPYRAADGILMVILMFGYAIHRFLDEMLRTDTEKVAFDLTLSQNVSILVFIAAIGMAIAVYRHANPGAPHAAAA